MFSVFALFPELLEYVSALIGFTLASNFLFTICIGCGLMIVMGLTVIVSYQKMRLKKLSQTIALLENRLELTEKKMDRFL